MFKASKHEFVVTTIEPVVATVARDHEVTNFPRLSARARDIKPGHAVVHGVVERVLVGCGRVPHNRHVDIDFRHNQAWFGPNLHLCARVDNKRAGIHVAGGYICLDGCEDDAVILKKDKN